MEDFLHDLQSWGNAFEWNVCMRWAHHGADFNMHHERLSLSVMQEDDARCVFGLLLYSLDRLYKAVERHAKETGEWPRLVASFMSYFIEPLQNHQQNLLKKFQLIFLVQPETGYFWNREARFENCIQACCYITNGEDVRMLASFVKTQVNLSFVGHLPGQEVASFWDHFFLPLFLSFFFFPHPLFLNILPIFNQENNHQALGCVQFCAWILHFSLIGI